MALTRPTEEERLAVCDWLTANGIDITTVPLYDSDLRITEQDGRRTIRYTEYVRDSETGNLLADPADRIPIRRDAATPCIVEPPAWLNIPGGRP